MDGSGDSLAVRMTRDAGEGGIISSIDVACAARDPDALIVCAGVNRE